MTYPCPHREGRRPAFLATLLLLPILLLLFASPAAATVHKVRKGDNLSRIAKIYRVPVREIREANSLASDDLMPGTRLVIPARAARKARQGGSRTASEPIPAVSAATATGGEAAPSPRHKVAKGDTLSSIAREHHVTVREIRRLNHLRKASRLRPGTELVVGPRSGVSSARRGPDPEALEQKLRSVAAAPLSDGEMAGTLPLREDAIKDGNRCANLPGGESISAGAAPPPGEESAPTSEGWDLTGKILSLAKSMLDVPYRFGGSTFRGIDCSGYVQKVFSYLNIPLPRSARQQFERGERIEKEQLEKGDVVFFQTYARFPSHVGIYVGDNQFIHASSRDHRVRIDSLDTPYYVKRYIGARRMLDPLGGAVLSAGTGSAEDVAGEAPEKEEPQGD